MASPDTDTVPDEAPPSGWLTRRRLLGLWIAITVALLLWVVLVPVATVSFVTNPISELSFRRVMEMSIPEVWAYQLDNLPDVPVPWAMTAAFAGAIAVSVVCVVLGCRMLLAPDLDGVRRGRSGRRA